MMSSAANSPLLETHPLTAKLEADQCKNRDVPRAVQSMPNNARFFLVIFALDRKQANYQKLLDRKVQCRKPATAVQYRQSKLNPEWRKLGRVSEPRLFIWQMIRKRDADDPPHEAAFALRHKIEYMIVGSIEDVCDWIGDLVICDSQIDLVRDLVWCYNDVIIMSKCLSRETGQRLIRLLQF